MVEPYKNLLCFPLQLFSYVLGVYGFHFQKVILHLWSLLSVLFGPGVIAFLDCLRSLWRTKPAGRVAIDHSFAQHITNYNYYNTLNMKRTNSSSKSAPTGKRQKTSKQLPAIRTGKRPIHTFNIIQPDGTQIPIRALLDTGSEIPVINLNFCKDNKVPWVKRDDPGMITAGFDGTPLRTSSQAQTTGTTIVYDKHVDTVTFLALPMQDTGYDMILPHWWLEEHQVTGKYTDKITFQGKECGHTHRLPGVQSRAPGSLPSKPVSFDPLLAFEEVKVCAIVVREEDIVEPVYLDELVSLPMVPTTYVGAVHNPAASEAALQREAYRPYLSVFEPAQAQKLPEHTSYDHAIDLEPGKEPPYGPIYSLSEKELTVLREELETLRAAGKIRPSKSPAGAPILFVPKSNGGYRMCVDYRGLNAVTIKNRYPLPLADQLREQVSGAKIFSKIDLKNGFNLIRIKPGDEWKTAFRTRYGHFEYLVMPFGLANAPASFQAMMNEVLRGLIDQGVVVYVDDILIYSKTEEEHERLVKAVLQRLHEAGLAANLEKSCFHQEEVEFLGHLVSSKGTTMMEDKVSTVLAWKAPKSIKGVQEFMGFANYYRRFIENFSKIAKPITDATKGDNKDFKWTPACEQAFNALKQAFTTAPILVHFVADRQSVLETDASDYALGGVLSQVVNKRLHPVAFHSRKLNPAERNYDIHDKEMLAIVDCFKTWRHLLEGARHQVIVYTDHKNLEYFTTTKIFNRRQARWMELLSTYDFKIVYRPGAKNSRADALSRRSEYRPEEGSGVTDATPTTFLQPHQMDWEPEASEILSRQTAALSISENDHVIFDSGRIAAISTQTFDHAFLQEIRKAGKQDSTWNEAYTMLEADPTAKVPKHLTLDKANRVLLWKNRLYIPDNEALRVLVLESEHDSKVAGHFGQDKTVELVARNFYWPSMEDWIRNYVSTCDSCQRNKSSRRKRYGLLQPLETPYAPWTSISWDFITGLPKTKNGNNAIWVIVDRFTKMAHFIPVHFADKKTSAPELAKLFLREVWRLHGLPNDIVSDRDTRFTSNWWATLMQLLDIRRKLSTAFHPQTDGQTERLNQEIEAYLRAFCTYEQDNWFDLLPMCEYAYNNSVTSATKLSPFYANYGYNPRTNWLADVEPKNPSSALYAHYLKATHDRVAQTLTETRERMGKYFNKKRGEQPPEIKVGCKVLIDGRNFKPKRPSKKLSAKKYGPFEVLKKIGNRAFRVELPPEMRIHNVFHVDLLELYRPSKIQGRKQAAPPPPEIEGDDEYYHVEAIIDSEKRDSGVHYLVKWSGYSIDESTYLPYEELTSCLHLLRKFHKENPEKPVDARVKRK